MTNYVAAKDCEDATMNIVGSTRPGCSAAVDAISIMHGRVEDDDSPDDIGQMDMYHATGNENYKGQTLADWCPTQFKCSCGAPMEGGSRCPVADVATTAQPRNRLPRTAEVLGDAGQINVRTTAAIRMADQPGWEAWYKFKAVEGHRYKILTVGSDFDPKLWVMRDGHAGVLGETPVEESDDHPAGPTITEATIDFDSYSSPSTSRCHPSDDGDMTQCSDYYVKVVGDVKGGGKSTLSITDMGKTEDLVGGGG